MPGSFAITGRHDGGVFFVAVRGLLQPAGLRQLREFVLNAVRERAVQAVVVDLRAIVVMFTAEDSMDVIVEGLARNALPMMPVGVVVPPGILVAALEYNRRAALLGVVRIIFTDADQAAEWAYARCEAPV